MQIVFEITKDEVLPGTISVPRYVLGIQAQIDTPEEGDIVVKGVEALKHIIAEPMKGRVVREEHPSTFREAGRDNPPPTEPSPIQSPQAPDPIITSFDPATASDDQIKAKIKELEKANKEAPGWGAAVGARIEWIKDLNQILWLRNRRKEKS